MLLGCQPSKSCLCEIGLAIDLATKATWQRLGAVRWHLVTFHPPYEPTPYYTALNDFAEPCSYKNRAMFWWLITIAIALVAVVCAFATWWWVPKWQVARFHPEISDPKDRADVEDNFRKSIGQLIGGAAVILGAGLAYYQTQQTLLAQHEQSEKTLLAQHEQSEKTLRAQEEQSKRTVSSQQISKGFELLSEKDSPPVKRLSAIYLLESVMRTADEYNASALDALSAFVRISTAKNADREPLAIDVQAALTVIGRHPSPAKVDLTGAQIPQAFLENASLIRADLIGINLNDAQLSGINLSGASLRNACLNGAKLFAANLSHSNINSADLSGAELINVDLTGATLINASLLDVNLSNADLKDAELNNANLDNADLRDARNLTQSQLNASVPKHPTSPSMPAACGTNTKLPDGLTIKPCPQDRVQDACLKK